MINKKIKNLLFTPNTKISKSNQKFNIILTPDFYWVRVFNIPLNYEYEAKKTLPSLFEDYLPKGSYEYKAIKIEQNRFLSFAYEKQKILNSLKKANISLNQINNIYFAQTEITKDVKIDKNYSLAIIDKPILSKIPNSLAKDINIDIGTYLKDYKPSKHYINLDYLSDIIDFKTSVVISILLILISFTNFAHSFIINSNINQLKKEETKLTKKFNLPKTTFEANAIIKRYENIYKQQINFRKEFKKTLAKTEHGKSFKLKVKN